MRAQSLVSRSLAVAAIAGVVGVFAAATPAREEEPSGKQIEATILAAPGEMPVELAPEVSRVEELLLPLLYDHPNVFAGSSITHDGRALRVFVTDAETEAVALARQAAGDLWDYVDLVQVTHSLSDLRASQGALRENRGEASAIASLSIYPEGNTLLVLLTPGDRTASQTAESLSALLTTAETETLIGSGLDRVVVDVEYGAVVNESKNADSGGKSGGAGYNYTDFDTGDPSICSYGLLCRPRTGAG